ncbi:HAMP domain-containing sensor histidine kinase [Paenibacillus algorifonticola]|uniref:ATP-binding protein n=1 Tax=Paenibacillus algorifonticola TaxID=684063 RepID=UPI003D2BABA3
MLFVLIALWGIALILMLSDPRSAVSRRLSGVPFTGGAGAMSVVLDERINPYVSQHYMNETADQLLYMLQAFCSLLSYYGLPYTFLLFALAYRPIDRLQPYERVLPLLLFIPIAACLLFTPGYTETYPITFTVVVWWAVPYVAVGAVNILLKNPGYLAQARRHWIVCTSVLTPVLFSATMNYVLPSLGFLRMWVYNTWFVGIGALVFVIGLFTYGFLGVRVFIDRRRLDSTLRAVTSGTAILNHAIKNDVGKMRLFGEKMRAYAASTNQEELLADAETMLRTTRHIQEMIGRVHHGTEDLALKPTQEELGELLLMTLEPYKLLAEGVHFTSSLPEGWSCMIDRAQVTEALGNLISNAIEAMDGKGALSLIMKETKRDIMIEVRDTGPGMDRTQTAKAFEPFYTTKRGGSANFGLGLPYAYHVMRKHGGSLHIQSKLGAGTLVSMIFKKKAIQAQQIAGAGTSYEHKAAES